MTARLNLADIIFMLDNVVAGSNPLPGADPLDPLGIRAIDGSNNNISGLSLFDQHGNFVDTSIFGSVNESFIKLSSSVSPYATQYASSPVPVVDSSPRMISNLIVDQTASNPSAVTVGPADLKSQGDASIDLLPFNSLFTYFGQFFDHGLDFVEKAGPGVVMIPLLPSDPLFDPTPGALNMMFLSRATVDGNGDALNTTAPFIEQSQTYGSTDATAFYLKEYDAMGNATGDLVGGANGLATWADIKDNANTWARAQPGADPATEMLTDADIGNIPDPTMWNPALNGGLGGFAMGAGTGQAFSADIAHNANPAGGLTADADDVINPNGFGAEAPAMGEYDNELLDAHLIAGDPRANENVVLTSIHETFHNEHTRILAEIQNWIDQEDILNPGFAAQWDGEMKFEAAKLANEMQYQHLVFEEFGRRMSPNIDEFGAYQVDINPNITAEFAHAVYRFGHSMLTDNVKAVDATGGETNLELIDAFLDPVMFADFGGADFLVGGQLEQGNQIDEFVVDALRNFLVGIPLDLAALNIARGRDVGLATLNQLRADLFAQTGEATLKPYESWDEFGANLLNSSSLVNFIAAYARDDMGGLGTDIVNARDSGLASAMDDARAAALVAMGDAGFMGVGGGQGFWDIDLWIGGLAEQKVPLGQLGSTFDFVFAQQMIALQNGDRFYYLGRIGGNLLDQIEGQTLSDLMMRGTGATHMFGDVFGTPDVKIELGTLGQDNLIKSPTEKLISLSEIIGGTNADNTIDGGAGNDAIYGDGGDDVLDAGIGDDHVYGGDGNDYIQGDIGFDFLQGKGGDDEIHGGADDDAVSGGDGNDMLFGDSGFDEVLGNAGDDIVHGGANDDAVLGGEGNDTVYGDDGNDGVDGEDGNDIVYGGRGDDALTGGAGDDMFFGGSGADAMDGGLGGYDIVSYEDWLSPIAPTPGMVGLTINMADSALSNGDARGDTYADIEALRGTNFDDMIIGDDIGHVLVGGFGDDTITGGLADDVLIGSEGNDRLIGGGGANDTVLYRGLEADFTLSAAIGGFTVNDDNAVGFDEGTDFVANDVTWINFDDALLNLTNGQYAPLIGLSDTVERMQNGTNVIGEAVSTQVVMDGTLFTPGGIFISDLEILDPDGAANGAQVITLGGADAASFEVINVNGVNKLFLGTAAGLLGGATNYEVKPVYNVTVNVADALGGSALNLTVNITDVNDNAPVFTSGDRVNVQTGTDPGVILYRAETSDLDTTGEAIAYTLGGADAALFDLVNGELRFKSAPDYTNALDVGNDNVYNVTIDATDGVNAADTRELSIHVRADGIRGTDASDTLNGTAGNDIILALAGDDVVNGLGGNDLLNGGAGDDMIDGGADNDTASYADALNAVEVYLQFTGIETGDGIDTLVDIENLLGSTHNDRLVGDMNDNIISGGAGNDILRGKGGNDTFNGGDGDDNIRGDAGNDMLFGGSGVDALFALGGLDQLFGGDDGDFLYGGGDNDVVNGDAGDDNLRGNGGQDSLFGGEGSDDLRGGGAGDFILDGGAGNDFLFGEGGSDTLHGGAGNDSLSGGSGGGVGDGVADTFIFMDSGSGSGGFDRIKDFENGMDVMDLTSFAFANFAAVTALASDDLINGAMRLDFGAGDVLYVENFSVAQFDAADVLI